MKILYISKNDGTDMRISKECQSLHNLFHEVIFVGWDRNPSGNKPDLLNFIEKKIFYKRADFGSKKLLLLLPLYYRHIIAQVIKYKPDVVHVVNEDLASLLLPLKPIFRFKLVCDIFDSISLKNTPLQKNGTQLAGYVAEIVWRFSDKLIVTDVERQKKLKKKYINKSYVVPNYPEDSQPLLYQTELVSKDKITLYVAGTLNEQRGLKNLLTLLESRNDLQVISAGWVYDKMAKVFIQNPAVEYLGVISPENSLKMAAKCDAIYAFYDPCNVNNLMASPNKVYDALCVGRSLIINAETGISKWIENEQLGYVFPYDDIEKFEHALEEIKRNRNIFNELSMRLREKFEQGYNWANAEKSLIELYEGLIKN